MYGKRRITITKKGQVELCGKHEGSTGGSCSTIGIIKETDNGFSCFVAEENQRIANKLIGTFKTKLECKIAIFNNCDRFDEIIDNKGSVLKK